METKEEMLKQIEEIKKLLSNLQSSITKLEKNVREISEEKGINNASIPEPDKELSEDHTEGYENSNNLLEANVQVPHAEAHDGELTLSPSNEEPDVNMNNVPDTTGDSNSSEELPNQEVTPELNSNEPNLVMPDGMPALEESENINLEMPTITSETEEKPENNNLVEPSLPVEEEKNNGELTEVTGFGQSPEKLSEIKGYFSSEELKAIINGYENNAPKVEEPKEEEPKIVNSDMEIGNHTYSHIYSPIDDEKSLNEIDSKEPNLEMPTVDEKMTNDEVAKSIPEEQSLKMPTMNENISYTVEEASPVVPEEAQYVGTDGPTTVVEPPMSTETAVEEPKVEEPVVKSNPEAVAENLANNFGDKERMLSIEEMLRNMEQDFEQGKGR